jgi:hypothetical protein
MREVRCSSGLSPVSPPAAEGVRAARGTPILAVTGLSHDRG